MDTFNLISICNYKKYLSAKNNILAPLIFKLSLCDENKKIKS